MREVFADTGYWIAVLDNDDDLHDSAMAAAANLGRVHMVTSEMVLTEVLNHFAGFGSRVRFAAVKLIEHIRERGDITIVEQTPERFDQSYHLYAQRFG